MVNSFSPSTMMKFGGFFIAVVNVVFIAIERKKAFMVLMMKKKCGRCRDDAIAADIFNGGVDNYFIVVAVAYDRRS